MSWSASGLMVATHIDKWDDSLLGLDLTSEVMWKAAFFGAAVTPNFNTDTAYNVGTWVLANESAGANYSPGGIAVVSTTLTAVSGSMAFDAANLQLDDSTIIAEGYLLYAATISNRAFGAVWFGEPKETQAGTFLVTHDPGGVAILDCTPA